MTDQPAAPGRELAAGQSEEVAAHGGDVAPRAAPGNLPRVSEIPQRLVVAILTDPGAVERLLDAYIAAGVSGATVLDGRGMREHRDAGLSLFAGFKAAFAAVGHSQVVIALAPAPRCSELLALCLSAGELAKPGTGIAFALDVPEAVGLAVENAEH